MRCLQLFRVIRTSGGIGLSRNVHIGAVLMRNAKAKFKVKGTRRINYEPGIKHREGVMNEISDFPEECEGEEDFEEDIDLSKVSEFYDMDQQDQRRQREKIGRIITMKKFFKSPQQPLTLTCNEIECIKYLHKSDPVQWDVKTLSQSFPAMPEAIKKVLKKKFNISPELKKLRDEKVQRNWELLAQGKLDASPEVLEHLKKFVNRKEVLLEQIKNSKFYLPEVKKEPVWNNGEMSAILNHYEKAVNKLIQKQEKEDQHQIDDGSLRVPKSNLVKVHEKIKKFTSTRDIEGKEDFSLGGMINAYSKPLTFPELQKELLLKADKNEQLHITEKAIVESAKGFKPDSYDTTFKSNVLESKSIVPPRTRQKISEEHSETVSNQNVQQNYMNVYDDKIQLDELEISEQIKELVLPDSRTKFIKPQEIQSFLDEVSTKPKTETITKPEAETNESVYKEKEGKERKEREDQYFCKQVKDIENTSFWNNGKTSKEKALLEQKKSPLGGPDMFGRGNFFNSDVYPERIKIPESKKGSGLTFRVRDCFYDDDGYFLYRVPGLV